MSSKNLYVTFTHIDLDLHKKDKSILKAINEIFEIFFIDLF